MAGSSKRCPRCYTPSDLANHCPPVPVEIPSGQADGSVKMVRVDSLKGTSIPKSALTADRRARANRLSAANKVMALQ